MRLAVLADIHGNVLALQAVMADLATRRVDAVVNLGDCVSGPLWPAETMALLRAAGWPTVRGNHDRWVGTGDAATLAGSDLHAWTALGIDDRQWLRDLPPQIAPRPGTVAFHACPHDDNAYLCEDQQGGHLVAASAATIARRLGATDATLVLTAHSHRPVALKLPEGPWILNPGSVGCPAYDDESTMPPHISEACSPAARYAIVEETSRGPMIELLSVPYDHEAAAICAAAHGRPHWAHALRTGFALPPTTAAA